jgi:hypothetical protein
MSQFFDLNAIYNQYFELMPPVRVCVALPDFEGSNGLVMVQAVVMGDSIIEKYR